MRLLALISGAALVALGTAAACSSSDDPAGDTPEAGTTDAPVTPPNEAGTDAPITGTGLQHSGTRIKFQGVDTAEGLFVQSAPYDSALSVVCYPGRTEDGNVHCLPAETVNVTVYADDTCTTGLAVKSVGSCNVATIAEMAVPATDPCDYKRKFWKLGAKLATPAKVYFKSGTTCVEQPPAFDGEYYALGAALPPSAFVGLKRGEPPISTALRAVVFDGEDGSRIQRSEHIDVARGKVCGINATTDGKTRCTPKSRFQTRGYTDGNCTSRSADPPYCVALTEGSDETTASTFELLNNCGLPVVRSFPLGAKAATRDEYSKDADGGACSGPVTSMSDVYEVGAEIAPATLPEITPSTNGGPRVVERTYLSAGSVAWHDDHLTDTTLTQTCRYREGPDGKLRCFPTGIGGSYYFSDMNCQTRLGNTQDPCEIGKVKYIVTEEGASCARTTHVYNVGTKLDSAATQLYIQVPDGNGVKQCTLVGSRSDTELYTLGSEVPATTFAEGQKATR